MKHIKLEWYVLQHDFNTNQIIMYNILGGCWYERVKTARKNKKFNDRESFKEWLYREFKYYYWSKSEREIAVSGLFVRDSEKDIFKIDAWFQIEPNLDNICDYLIKKMNFRFGESKYEFEEVIEERIKEMEDKTIIWVKELYNDEENTLTQGIMYRYGDDRERDYVRSRLVPYVTKLIRTEYLNCKLEVIRRDIYERSE